ncbi:6873_t:CDS:2, partial [Racocetra persica]
VSEDTQKPDLCSSPVIRVINMDVPKVAIKDYWGRSSTLTLKKYFPVPEAQ